MRSRSLVLIFVLVATAYAVAQERITLTTPESYPTNPAYRLERLDLNYDQSTIAIYLRGANGELVTCNYGSGTNPTGATLLNGLNKANLSSAYAGNGSTGSLVQRIFHRLIVMNESATVCTKALTGTITGSVP